MKKTAAFCLSLLFCIPFFSGCSLNNGQETSTESDISSLTEQTSAETPENVADIKVGEIGGDETDALTVSEAESDPNSVKISLSKSAVNVTGNGVKVNGLTVTVGSSGTYLLSGELDGGEIIVDTTDKETVILLLNGVNITSSSGPAIFVKNAEKVIITLAQNTSNTLTDSSEYNYNATLDDSPNAALHSKADLVLNGKGSLTVNGNYNDGINCRDTLKILSCTLNITSVDDGITGKDAVITEGAVIKINAGGDGIKSTNAEDADRGYLSLTNSTVTVVSANDALQAETNLYITGGTYNLTTGGGSANASTKSGKENPGWGMWGNNSDSSSEETTESAKGIKALSLVKIQSGTFSLDTSDDSIHSNNAVQIVGGTFELSSGDDGIHADTRIDIYGGEINISKSYEGIESVIINISGGNILIEASDDGININGGDGSALGGRPGQGTFTPDSSGNQLLTVSGGKLYVNASGDGLDSNGSINMTGGTVVVDGPTNDGNGALDYAGEFTISGGTLVAIGPSGMLQSLSESSAQYSVTAGFGSSQNAGTAINLSDISGNTILTVKARKQFSSVVISTPDIKKGTEYTVSYGGNTSSQASYGLINDNSYSGGTVLGRAKAESSVTVIGTVNSGFGMGGGGMPPGGRR